MTTGDNSEQLATDVVTEFDAHKANAYGPNVKFDLALAEKSRSPESKGDASSYNPEISVKTCPPKNWETDVKGLYSTKQWLQNYGLKRNRLDMSHILPQIGFRHSNDFDTALKRPICSRYGEGLFPKYSSANGRTVNVACTKQKLHQLENRLSQAICLYKRRLDWLTTESRRIFGVIEERSVAIVLDINNLSPQQFDQYRSGLERTLKEQVSQLAKFNVIRASEDLNSFSQACVPVSNETIDGAISWLWGLERTASVSTTSTCEALVKALADQNCEAVYLFTEGSASDGTREILKGKLTGVRLPVHVVSFNCTSAPTIEFLKDLSKITGARFHAYAVLMEVDSYEGQPLDPGNNQANIILRKKTYGGVPPGAGVRDDAFELFEELEKARTNLEQVQALLEELPDPKLYEESRLNDQNAAGRQDQYMSSREWLDKYGLKARKLGFYDVLASVAFKHQDGVVDLKMAPREHVHQTDAVTRRKLVNARYCDRFPLVRWKDGQVVHVHVTPEVHRNYEQRVRLGMEAFQQRIDWLQQGSRELFGTVVEDRIYILIDTSASMAPHIQFVKDKLFVLMQEQLRHKQRFNIIAFDSKCSPWKDRLVEVSEKNLQNAWHWIKMLSCRGSTNTLGALRHALSDNSTEAVYLLTDGRPDQPPHAVLAQVQLHPSIPVHTISFNCADREANEFLCQLAKDTSGRFHYYSENGLDPEGPDPWESEDIRLLRQEMEQGFKNLEKLGQLRDECAVLSWSQQESPRATVRSSVTSSMSATPRHKPVEPYTRPNSAPGFAQPAPPHSSRTPRPATSLGLRGANTHRARIISTPRSSAESPRMQRLSSRQSRKKALSAHLSPTPRPMTAARTRMHVPRSSGKNVAGHTKTSLLRTLGSGGSFGSSEWLLPETRGLIDKQWSRLSTYQDDEDEQRQRQSARSKKQTRSKNMSVKRWLSIHGLKARKLTILDVLAPTFIPHTAKYIPILGKNVRSRVFDESMLIAHTTDDKKKQRLVNPQGVNLGAYIDKVEKAVDRFQKKLDLMVWNGLSAEERDVFDSVKPVPFDDNKLALMQALDRLGWPVPEKDIMLLEREVKQGQEYIQQARDLQEAARNGGKGLEEEEGGSGSENEKEAAEKPQRSQKKSSKTTKPKKKTRETYTGILQRGLKVIARRTLDGFFYPGKIVEEVNQRQVGVRFDDLEQEDVPTTYTIPMHGAIARPRLWIDDYVLGRVINRETDLECYIPGQVIMTPVSDQAQAKFYCVQLYTGQEADFLRSFLVKIPRLRYIFSVRYIQEVNKAEDAEEQASSRGSSRTGSRSRSRSRSRSQSRSRSRSGSRSRSRSGSRSGRRSRSRSGSRSGSGTEVKKDHKKSPRSRSRSDSRDKSSRKERPSSKHKDRKKKSDKNRTSDTRELSAWQKQMQSPKMTDRDVGNSGNSTTRERQRLLDWQKQLEDKQKQQEDEQSKLKKQAKKLHRLKKKMKDDKPSDSQSEEQRSLLQQILDQMNRDQENKASARSSGQKSSRPDSDDRQGNTPRDTEGSEETLPALLQMRKDLPPVREGEEVLARWCDEGWYYRGTIVTNCGDFSYIVKDCNEEMERIWREDILTDTTDGQTDIAVGDHVVASHPDYNYSYCPGKVTKVISKTLITVLVYDQTESTLSREEMYYIPEEKYKMDTAYIIERELEWVNQAVVARNDQTGMYQMGFVKDRVGNGRQYSIQFADESECEQSVAFMFGGPTKRCRLTIGDNVLALVNPDNMYYLPGIIEDHDGTKISVRFCDGTWVEGILDSLCFWLSPEFYSDAVAYYHDRQTTPRSQPASTDSHRTN